MKNIIKTHTFFFLVIFLHSFSGSFGQAKYSDEELMSFFKVYDYMLRNPFQPLEAMQKLLPQTSFTEERMTEIMQAEVIGRKVNLSEQEKADQAKLKQLIQKEKEKYDANIDKMMKQEKLSRKRFEEIKKAFHQDSKIQQKVYALVEKKK